MHGKTRSSATAKGPRDALLENSCNVLRGTGVIKVSNSESHLQGHSRALTIAPFDRPHTIFY